MIPKKLTYLAAATVIGSALIAAPAEAQFRGGGMRGGGGFAAAHVGGFGGIRGGGGFAAACVGGFGGGLARGPAFVGRSALIGRPAFVGRSAFIGRSGFVSRSAFINRPVFVNRPVFAHRFPHRRFVFFHRRHFIAPFFGVGVLAAGYGYSSCWRWVPTYYGVRRVWVCDYPYGNGDYGYF
jgi:hypothetical protein